MIAPLYVCATIQMDLIVNDEVKVHINEQSVKGLLFSIDPLLVTRTYIF